MLTWAVAYTIVNANVVGTMLFVGIIGDILITLFIASVISDVIKHLARGNK